VVPADYFLPAHGFFVAHGFFAAQGFFAAHGFFAAAGFLAAHGFFAAHGFLAAQGFFFTAHGFFAAQGFVCATPVPAAIVSALATATLVTNVRTIWTDLLSSHSNVSLVLERTMPARYSLGNRRRHPHERILAGNKGCAPAVPVETVKEAHDDALDLRGRKEP
jgi:hypothetical protein